MMKIVKTTKKKMKLIDYVLILGIAIVFLVGIFLVTYYFNFQNNECFRDPLIYGAKQMEELYGGTFSGYGSISSGWGRSLTFFFDSNNITSDVEETDSGKNINNYYNYSSSIKDYFPNISQ